MLLDTAEGSANLKDKAPYGRFVTQYPNKGKGLVFLHFIGSE